MQEDETNADKFATLKVKLTRRPKRQLSSWKSLSTPCFRGSYIDCFSHTTSCTSECKECFLHTG